MIAYKTTKKLDPVRLFNLYKSVGWTNGVKNSKKHGELLSKTYADSDVVLSAWEGKELVGVVRFITDKNAHGFLYGLAVDPQHHGTGVGSILMKKAIAYYPKIQWSAEMEDKKSLSFFKSIGFKVSKNILMELGDCPV